MYAKIWINLKSRVERKPDTRKPYDSVYMKFRNKQNWYIDIEKIINKGAYWGARNILHLDLGVGYMMSHI